MDTWLELSTSGQLRQYGGSAAANGNRGAGHSAGKTSWTAKPERDDYASVIGFITYYAAMLDTMGEEVRDSKHNRGQPCLLLGGYSYGSILTALLPPLDEILNMFETPSSDSDAAQIRLRAESLAEQQNTALRAASRKRLTPTSPSKTNIRVGGDEGCSPRRSHDSGHRGFSLDEELFRKGVHDLLHKRKSRPDLSASHHNGDGGPAEGKLPRNEKVVVPKAAYLLISPIQGVASHLVTLSALPSAMSRQRDMSVQAAEDKLVKSPTLAVYGGSDGFTQLGKMRAWANRLESQEGSLFKAEEIETAGHFWAEEGVLRTMLRFVDGFAKQLTQQPSIL